MGKPTDIRIREARIAFADYLYRTPIKFGGRALDRVTLLDAAIEVESRSGERATGFGSMTLGNVWSWPSKTLSYDETLSAMKALAAALARAVADLTGGEFADAVETGAALEALAFSEAARSGGVRGEVMPRLAALVTASPFDAAVHDAFGKAAGANVYSCYGPDFLNRDLSHYLDASFAGEYLDRYTLARPKGEMPLYHLVGALDPLVGSDVEKPVGDGLPETLRDWIIAEGLTHLKVKLNGDDLDWDVARVLAVSRVADEIDRERGARDWRFSLDFNEKCRSVEYLLEFLARIREGGGAAFDRVQYIEQPTARDLAANPGNTMHEAAAIKPVVIDESLLDYDSMILAEKMGYSGVALKACKGQTQSVVLAAAAQKKGLFLCVQDLTCVGASYLHSISLASRVPGVAAVEANGRQYCPSANREWAKVHPEAFEIVGGLVRTGGITGSGLGIVAEGAEPL